MNTQKLLETIETIKRKSYPKEYEEFGGAELIVTNDKNYTGHEGDTVVYTNYNYELSWLVYQLGNVYHDEIDYMNKYAFYPGLGDAMNEGILRKDSLKEIMLSTVIQSILFWIIPLEMKTKKEVIFDLLEEMAGKVPESEDDGITIGEILKANEAGKPIARDRNSGMHEWMSKLINH